MKKGFIIGIVLITMLSGLATADLNEAIFWYDFNQGVGTELEDVTTNGNDLTSKIGSPTNVTGINLSAHDFQFVSTFVGDAWVGIPLSVTTSAWSFTYWFKADSSNLYQMYYKTGGGYVFCYWHDGLDISCRSNNGGGTINNKYIVSMDADWHHLAYTYDGANTRLYWDGSLVGTKAETGSFNFNGNLNIGAENTPKNFFTGNIDEFGFYANLTLSAGDVAELYNNGASLNPFLAAPTPPPPTIPNETISETYNNTNFETINKTFNILFENFNASNTSTATLNYASKTYSGVIDYTNSSYFSFNTNATSPLVEINNTNISFNWSYNIVRFNGTNATDLTSTKNQLIYWGYYPTILYASDSIESETEQVYFDFNSLGYANLSNYQIEWLGTNYSATLFDPSTAYANLTYPQQNITSKVYNYTGHLNVTFDGVSYIRNVAGNNTVYQIYLTNCSTGTPSIEFLLSDERGLYWLNAQTIDLDLTVWTPFGNTSLRRNYDFTYTDTYNASVCITPSFATYTLDAYIINNVEGTYAHRYYTVNANISNTTQTANMYNFNSTEGLNTIEVLVVDQYYSPISDVLVKLLRYYPGGGAATVHANTNVNYASSFQTVQMDKTDEFGTSSFQVSDSGDVDYKIIFEQNNSILRETSIMYLYCSDPTDCTVTFQIDTSTITPMFTLFTNFNWSYNNDTEMVTVDWDDTTQLTDEISIYVTRETLAGSNQICGQTFITPSGSFNCNTTGQMGSIRVRGFRTASPLKTFLDVSISKSWEDLQFYLTQKGISSEGTFWAAAIAMLIVTSAATSVLGVIMATILALIVIMFMGLTNVVTISFVTIAVIVAMIVAVRLKQ